METQIKSTIRHSRRLLAGISAVFIDEMPDYFREHRDVGFYAQQACLSAKHFSAVIKEETGQFILKKRVESK